MQQRPLAKITGYCMNVTTFLANDCVAGWLNELTSNAAKGRQHKSSKCSKSVTVS